MNPPADSPRGFNTAPEPIAAALTGRRTIHSFQPESPPQDDILAALEAARWAPNHRHTEPWRFRLAGPETVARIVELNTRLVAEKKGAEAARQKQERWSAVPGWLIATCLVCDDPLQCEEDYAACCCALQNMALSLWSRGVGMKWTTGPVVRHPEFPELAGFDPVRERVVGLVWYGYPEKIPQQQRKPLEEIVQTLP